MSVALHENPVTDGQPVQGVCEGRMVAYWPTQDQEAAGLRAVGSGGYIPAMITAAWVQKDYPSPMPCANIRLFTDGCNVRLENVSLPGNLTADGCLGSVRFSQEPATGCWTWIPKV